MRYYKVYHRNCIVNKAYHEITHDNFRMECDLYASDIAPVCTDDEGNIGFDKYEKEIGNFIETMEAKAKMESGRNCGDYSLYIRPDDFDMYDIVRW